MTIYTYALLRDPNGSHAYALHQETIDARAADIRDADPAISEAHATVQAENEARTLARTDQAWPDSWYDTGEHELTMLTLPLHADLEAEIDDWHWQDATPALPNG